MLLIMAAAAASFIYLFIVIQNDRSAISKDRARINRLIVQGQQAHTVLCRRLTSLNLSIKRTQVFIDTHPKGFAGIPISLIRAGMVNQIAERVPLLTLDCPSSARHPPG
jgi:hypothetical protein